MSNLEETLQGVIDARRVMGQFYERLVAIVQLADVAFARSALGYSRFPLVQYEGRMFGREGLVMSRPESWTPAWPTAFWAPRELATTTAVLAPGSTPTWFAFACFALADEERDLAAPEVWTGLLAVEPVQSTTEQLVSFLKGVYEHDLAPPAAVGRDGQWYQEPAPRALHTKRPTQGSFHWRCFPLSRLTDSAAVSREIVQPLIERAALLR
ncbi:MAG: hypothetical protein JWM10_5480 [Myxococcaceae bacterium]|nr:hypothetical protein [Myxococcaceae bacterium]